jgi:hypothetical protein
VSDLPVAGAGKLLSIGIGIAAIGSSHGLRFTVSRFTVFGFHITFDFFVLYCMYMPGTHLDLVLWTDIWEPQDKIATLKYKN